MTTLSTATTRRSFISIESSVPTSLRPAVRAYILAYGFVCGPRLLTLLIASLRRWLQPGKNSERPAKTSFCRKVFETLTKNAGVQRFPTFAALLIGGSTLLQIPLRRAFETLYPSSTARTHLRLARWHAAFVSAWLSLMLLQSKKSHSFIEQVPDLESIPSPDGKVTTKTVKYAGRTMDLTLLALSRAVDVVIGELWSQRRLRREANGRWNRLDATISKLADAGIFAASCTVIMWAWTYLPERLPRAYNRWITAVSGVDHRLMTALREARQGLLTYGDLSCRGKDYLISMCADYNWPAEWAWEVLKPIPCEIVHMNHGGHMNSNCELACFVRLWRGFLMGASIYLPLNLAVQVRNPSLKSLQHAIASSIRSSAFLGSFIGLFYYGVCLARTRIGPHLIGPTLQDRQRLDDSICIATGSVLCGWSILLEVPGRRKDIALFVLPRAMAATLPRRYDVRFEWRERFVFAVSSAIVMTCCQENPARVRGVLGKLLGTLVNS